MKIFSKLFAAKKSPEKKQRRVARAVKKNIYTMSMELPVYQEWLSDDEIEKIENDAIVSSSMSIRKSATLKKEVRIQTKRDDISENFTEIFDFVFRQQALDCAFQGFSLFELNWSEKSGLLYPEPVERDYREFAIRNNKVIYLPLYQEVEPLKCAYAIYQPKFNKPMGRPLYHTLFWLRHFKAGSVEFWLDYMERFGTPWVVGKTAEGNKDEMAEQLYAMLGGDVAAIDEEDDIKIVTPSAKGEFKELSVYCDDQIRETILGGNLTGEAKSGSYAAAKVHNDIREDIAMIDEQIVTSLMSQIVAKFKKLNNIDDEIIVSLKDQDSPNYELAERDVKIVAMSGGRYRVTKEYIEKTYHVEVEESPQPAVPNRAYALAQPKPRDKIEKEAGKVDTKEAEAQILEQVEKLFDGAESFEEAIDAIYKAYPDFDTQKVEQMIEKLYANSFIYGQARIGEDHESEL